MPEARSRAHYIMVWEAEIKSLGTLGWSVSGEDFERVKEIQDELREIVKRGSMEVKKPDTCPDCGNEDYYCGYRKLCPNNVIEQ